MAIVLAYLLFGLYPPSLNAQGKSPDFYDEKNAILSVTKPIILGEEGFRARASALADGGVPFGLVLSGGSARAFAHIGVLQVLEDEGIRPDYIVADSMGAIVALLYGAGLAPEDIAALFEAFPAASLFDPELPLSGGFLDAGRFIGLVRALVGDLDLSELPIPVMVVCEDLPTRRQALIAEGDFATVTAASFALPAVFEPVRLGELLLIDGGVTSLVPLEAAYRYGSRVVAATALYDRKLDYSSPFVVINRAIDIGKTRSSIESLLEHRPLVIRCAVEDLSYMEFSKPYEVAARGKASALEAVEELRALAPARPIDPGLASARLAYHLRVESLAAAGRLGASFDRPLDSKVIAVARLLDDAQGESRVFSGRRWAGLGYELSGGPACLSLSSLLGLEGEDDRAWDMVFGLTIGGYVFPRAEGSFSGLAYELRLDSVLSGSSDSGNGAAILDPRELACAATVDLGFPLGQSLVFRPLTSAEFAQPVDGGEASWSLEGRFGLELRPMPELSFGFAPGAGFDSLGNKGPGAKFEFGWEPFGVAALRLKGTMRSALEGPGLEASDSDPYRSRPLSGQYELRSLFGAEAAWIARPFELSFGELFILKKPEIGFYADLSAAGDPGDELISRLYFGIESSVGVSVLGLAPFELSSFAGMGNDGSGWLLGIRAGRWF
jgi:predicted acylesterase/phospholipase RssA